MKKFILLLGVFSIFCFTIYDEASAQLYPKYWAGKTHIPYDQNASGLTDTESEYLSRLIRLIDMAYTNNKTAEEAFGDDDDNSVPLIKYNIKYRQLINALNSLTPLQDAKLGQNLIVEAIHNQAKFYQRWGEAPIEDDQKFRRRVKLDSDMKKARSQLSRAYRELSKAFPKETQQNKRALQNYLNALGNL